MLSKIKNYIKLDALIIVKVISVVTLFFIVDKKYGTNFSQFKFTVGASIYFIYLLDLHLRFYALRKISKSAVIEAITIKVMGKEIPLYTRIKLIAVSIDCDRYRIIESFVLLELCLVLATFILVLSGLMNSSLFIPIVDLVASHIFCCLIVNIIIIFLEIKVKRIKRSNFPYEKFPLYFNSYGIYENKYKGLFKINHTKIFLYELEYEKYSLEDLRREFIFLKTLTLKSNTNIFSKYFNQIFVVVIAGSLPLVNAIFLKFPGSSGQIINYESMKIIVLFYLILLILIFGIVKMVNIIIDFFIGFSSEDIMIKMEIVESFINKKIKNINFE